MRSQESLQYVDPGGFKTFHVGAGGDNPTLTIESDFILDGQKIDYYGTTYTGTDEINHLSFAKVYPNCLSSGDGLVIDSYIPDIQVELIDLYGRTIMKTTEKRIQIPNLAKGIYFLRLDHAGNTQVERIIIQ